MTARIGQGLFTRIRCAATKVHLVVEAQAVAADQLHSRSLLNVAERTARYVVRHLPASGVPRWDYDAPTGASVDVSAGVITATGLFHLVGACRQLGRPCPHWTQLARHMLAAALSYASI